MYFFDFPVFYRPDNFGYFRIFDYVEFRIYILPERVEEIFFPYFLAYKLSDICIARDMIFLRSSEGLSAIHLRFMNRSVKEI